MSDGRLLLEAAKTIAVLMKRLAVCENELVRLGVWLPGLYEPRRGMPRNAEIDWGAQEKIK